MAAAVRLAAFSSLFGLCRACPFGPCNARIRPLGWSSLLTSLRNARRYSVRLLGFSIRPFYALLAGVRLVLSVQSVICPQAFPR